MLEGGEGGGSQLPPPQILVDQKLTPTGGRAAAFLPAPQIVRLCSMPVVLEVIYINLCYI